MLKLATKMSSRGWRRRNDGLEARAGPGFTLGRLGYLLAELNRVESGAVAAQRKAGSWPTFYLWPAFLFLPQVGSRRRRETSQTEANENNNNDNIKFQISN